MFKYLLPVRDINAMCTRSNAGSMRPNVGRPVAKARAISGLLMKTTAGEAVGEQHLVKKNAILLYLKMPSNHVLHQWFSTFFSSRHTKVQKRFGGKLIPKKLT